MYANKISFPPLQTYLQTYFRITYSNNDRNIRNFSINLEQTEILGIELANARAT